MSDAPPADAPHRHAALRELAAVFLRLGLTAFGGPAAHVALFEEEFVRRRAWLSRPAFLDLLGATNLIPGPNSTELAIHIGRVRAGWRGLLVAGTCFILPAALIVGALAAAYVRLGRLPASAGLLAGALAGVTPVVLAIIARAVWALGATALRARTSVVIGAAALALAAAGVHELVVLVLGALAAVVAHRGPRPPRAARDGGATVASRPALAIGAPAALLAQGAPALAAVPPTGVALAPLFAVFAKIGSVLFGSGYVLLAFLRADLVARLGWLSERQLLDAVAIGQVTPGPLFTTATFIGYLLAGPTGAVVATLGIFLPAFAFVALSAPLLPRLRASPALGAALDGLNVASLALMALVALQLARSALRDLPSVALAILALALLIHGRVTTTWLVLGGATLGLARAWLPGA